jgi:N-methylhydantoinase A
MGGTSTDVSICPGGKPLYRSAAEIDGIAVHAPMVDIITVGAGGGSIARIDGGGALRVGPESAGADPGPACYGRGELPTVSDANAALGRLRPEQPLAGSLRIDVERASTAVATLGGDSRAMSRAVVEVVNANMATALRRVSLERGYDPAGFTLVAFGGSGPLHCCELAAEVGIPRVLIPRHPGVLSALGMVTAPLALEVSAPAPGSAVAPAANRLAAAVRDEARPAGWSDHEIAAATEAWSVDARYLGQGHELRVPLQSSPKEAKAIAREFHAAHEQRFGYSDREGTVEIVNIRLRLECAQDTASATESTAEPVIGAPEGTSVEAGEEMVTVYERASLSPGNAFEGPAIVTQVDATAWIPRGWAARVDAFENLLLEPRP